MPIFLAALGGVLLNIAGSVVGRVLLGLGIGFVTYSGLGASIDWLKTSIQNSFAGMPADTLSFLAWLWVDKAISLLFSAYTVAMTFKLAGSTVMRKMVQKS